jgi:hypothetical protein
MKRKFVGVSVGSQRSLFEVARWQQSDVLPSGLLQVVGRDSRLWRRLNITASMNDCCKP